MLFLLENLKLLSFVILSLVATGASILLYDGRVPLHFTSADLDASRDPFLTVVKGTKNASQYSTLHTANTIPPTPLWSHLGSSPPFSRPSEQVISVSIDNTSIFSPGGSNPQTGFRRTDIIAQHDHSPANLVPILENGTTVFHFSIKPDESRPLNYKHEYQIVFIEPSDGSHVFGIQLGTPFSLDPNMPIPSKDARYLKVLDHGLNNLFETPFIPAVWHNFAVQVDWGNRTLGAFYSAGAQPLAPVTHLVPNPSVQEGDAGTGDFHFGVLKLPLVDPDDPSEHRGDVVHYGIQEGTTEGLHYSGVFVESIEKGVSLGHGLIGRPLSE